MIKKRFYGGSSGGQPTTTSTVQNSVTQPWASAQPYLQQGINAATSLYAQGPQQYTPFDQVANFDPLQTQAMNGIDNYVNSSGTQNFMGTAQQSVSNGLSGAPNQSQAIAGQGTNQLAGYLSNNNLNDPSQSLNQMAYGNNTNPFTQANVGNTLQQLSNQFSTQTLPGMRDQAIGNGSYGSSRNEMLEGQAAGAVNSQMASAAQTGYGNAYNTQQTNSLNALGQLANNQQAQAANTAGLFNAGNTQNLNAQSNALSGYQNALNMPLSMLQQQGMVGTQQQTQNQDQLNNATNAWNFAQDAPYNNLTNYASLLNGTATLGGSNAGSAYNQSYNTPYNGNFQSSCRLDG